MRGFFGPVLVATSFLFLFANELEAQAEFHSCRNALSGLKQSSLINQMRLEFHGKSFGMPTISGLSQAFHHSFNSKIWLFPSEKAAGYSVVSKSDDGIFFNKASSIEHLPLYYQGRTHGLVMTGNASLLLAAFEGESADEIILHPVMLTNADTGQLGLYGDQHLTLPVRSERFKFLQPNGLGQIWFFDGDQTLSFLSSTEEGGLEMMLQFKLPLDLYEGVGPDELQIVDIHLAGNGQEGFVEISAGEEQNVLIPFELDWSDSRFNFHYLAFGEIRIPSDRLGWELHPKNGFVYVLRPENKIEIYESDEASDEGKLVYQQSFGDQPFEFLRLGLYHDTEISQFKDDHGQMRISAVGPYRILIQARHRQKDELKLLWLNQGP